ncbi:DNA polymerase III subunit delta' [Tissierella sp. P1]|uniref:DNA polymerase III subunit delta' n=1 Tax=Tissierella sp. P1 TaxID=1280483 RepID=UPI000BA046A3|nr:DNA polymerase III subunit delta' [Tissierella sp. P1]OZV12603.1 DNA polymerase III subunit delta' [Tissierella sp. P1]
MDFNKILGHEKQIEALKNSIRNKSISHCYLFKGEKGLGKRNLALAFSKTLLCREGQAEPCNKCSSCIKFDSENHPDFKILSPEKGIIKKSEIEKLINSMATSPFESKRKVFIIDDCDMMRLESQNALLKTLEEPPEYINIILVTSSSSKLLPTILSRCQIVKFYPLDISKIIDLLMRDYGIDENRAKFIAGITKGSVEKSIELAESNSFFDKREEIIKIIDGLLKGDKTKALTSMDFFNENKENIEEILDIILYWFRDLLIYKEIGNTGLLINKDKIEILSKESFIDLNRINDIIYKVEDTKINIKRNVNFSLSIETMLLSI